MHIHKKPSFFILIKMTGPLKGLVLGRIQLGQRIHVVISEFLPIPLRSFCIFGVLVVIYAGLLGIFCV